MNETKNGDRPKTTPEALAHYKAHALSSSLLQMAQMHGAEQIFLLLVMPNGQIVGEFRGDPERACESFGKMLGRSFGGATLRRAVQRFAAAVSGYIRGGDVAVLDEENLN